MTKLLKTVFHSTRRKLARFWLSCHPKIKIIGVTGSYGKTSTVKAIEAVLKKPFKTITTATNLDTIYNLPITLLKINSQTQVLILEYCVDRRGEMKEHLNLVKPEIAVITGITPVHSEKKMLGSIEGIVKEKSHLIKSLPSSGYAIMNYDDPLVAKMASAANCPVITYGRKKEFDFYFSDVKVSKKGTAFEAHFQEQKRVVTKKVKLSFLGEHFAQEALAALAVAKILNLNLDQACRSLEKLSPLPGRMSLEKGPQGSLLINDSLRANPASTIAGLKTLSAINHQGSRIAVLGEMGELGQYQEREHYRIGKFIAQLGNIDYLITLGPATKKIIQGAIKNGFSPKKAFYANSYQEAARELKKLLNSQTLWYLKGSLLKHMERILIILSEKEVACQKISCHNYYHCSDCPKLS